MSLPQSFLRKTKGSIDKVELASSVVGIEKARTNVVASIDAHIKAWIDRERSLTENGNRKRVKRVTRPAKDKSGYLAVDLRYGATERIYLADEDNGSFFNFPRNEERSALLQLRQLVIDGGLDDEIQHAADRVTETMNKRVLSARKGPKKAAPQAAD